MKNTTLIFIAIISDNNVLAKNGKVPWHISRDLAHFKKITLHHPIIMGHKTYQAIGKPLVDRLNIIVSRDTSLIVPGCTVVNSIETALEVAANVSHKGEVFVIGGGDIFHQLIFTVDKLYLTIVHESIVGEVFFPDYSVFKTVLYKEDVHEDAVAYTFLDLKR